MDMRLDGKRALVCGASAGIGRATAFALAAQGASCILLARRITRLLDLQGELAAAGLPPARVAVADLDRRDELCGLVSELLEDGPVHILVNNTGGPPGGPLLAASEADFLSAFGRHVLAAHRLTGLMLPGMQETGYGRILNIVSTSVYEPIRGLGVSNTIRGAMAAWAKTLSDELPPGVTVNNVLPGFTDTGRLASLKRERAQRSGATQEAIHSGWLAQVPEGRLACPGEVASAVAFLASPAAAYIRGASLPVDGGRLRGI
jgi:3-oxoacyl-[acyl-carrier protein] reductase